MGMGNDDLPRRIAPFVTNQLGHSRRLNDNMGVPKDCHPSCPSTPTMASSPPKRVCIVGAGASGMAAAYALGKHPDKFVVTVFDKEHVTGGMATSIDIDLSKYGAAYINDGVQGCSPAFANSLRMFRILGFEATEVGMQCVHPVVFYIIHPDRLTPCPGSALGKGTTSGPTSSPPSSSPNTREISSNLDACFPSSKPSSPPSQ